MIAGLAPARPRWHWPSCTPAVRSTPTSTGAARQCCVSSMTRGRAVDGPARDGTAPAVHSLHPDGPEQTAAARLTC
jgi:hypothetical protein